MVEKTSFELIQILPKELENENLLLKKALCCEVTRKETSKILSKVKENKLINFKEYNLEHLKGVKQLEFNNLILITFIDSNTNYDEIAMKLEIDKCQLKEVEIPTIIPYTKKQFSMVHNIWPLNVFPNKLSLSIYTHTTEETEIIADIISKLKKTEAILFDPEIKKTYISQKSASYFIESEHPTLNLINCFSQRITNSKNLKCNTLNLELGLKEEQIDYELKDKYYLTGMYIFLLNEPCIMCTFALIHSRIERIYFLETNISQGGLISKLKMLDFHNKINHFFKVFQIKYS